MAVSMERKPRHDHNISELVLPVYDLNIPNSSLESNTYPDVNQRNIFPYSLSSDFSIA